MNAKVKNYFPTCLLCFVVSCSQSYIPTDSPSPVTGTLFPSALPSVTPQIPAKPSQTSENTPTLRPTELAFLSTTASVCERDLPPSLTDFFFGGRLLLVTQNSTNHELWEMTNDTQQIRSIGKSTSNFGARLRLSPDGKWILSTTTWNPLENEAAFEPLVVSSNLSHTFTLKWNQDWDITLGWWDNSKIIVLPANGRTSEIVLLDVFTQATSTINDLELAVNRDYGGTFWSPWREKDGVTVFFNHAFSQVLFFDQSDSLALANIFERQPLWAYNRPDAFFSDNQESASWSPNDEFVAFPAWRGLFQDVYLLSKTGLVRQITNFITSGKFDVFVRIVGWSPDSTQLAFTARSTNETQTSSSVFVLDLLKREVRDLCIKVDGLVWSPNSRYLSTLVVNQEAPNKSQLVVIDTQTGEKWLIAENDEILRLVGWSNFP